MNNALKINFVFIVYTTYLSFEKSCQGVQIIHNVLPVRTSSRIPSIGIHISSLSSMHSLLSCTEFITSKLLGSIELVEESYTLVKNHLQHLFQPKSLGKISIAQYWLATNYSRFVFEFYSQRLPCTRLGSNSSVRKEILSVLTSYNPVISCA